MMTPPVSIGSTVLHSLRPRESAHERATHASVAQRLGALLGLAWAGDFTPGAIYAAPRYLVPSDTLVGAEQAHALGVRSESDFFGGLVPHPFVATKAITHPLLHAEAQAPEGWNPAFAEAVQESVLRGFTAFSLADARQAGQRLLALGPVRLKPVRATAGRGQVRIENAQGLDAALAQLDAAELAVFGVVLEENLEAVATYSVGQVRVGGQIASYYGTQRLTRDNRGEEVYGGSTLTVARGGFAELCRLMLPVHAREAIAQAQRYDAAADAAYPGLLASRRNYDTVVGQDAAGRRRSGVLEQSWRIGGASGAEALALQTLAQHPDVRSVRAATVEVYGTDARPPEGASVHYHGDDDEVGPILKYACLDPSGPGDSPLSDARP
ncbi:DUF3182 family protein [Achromobacter sp. GG226]|uniref:DUF3182 family protein n=1 Tax=Verticiella alkaliphila TaxID=2779529 RepID=UPI001C0BB901|nr:DUF3182 family protein [Verticiella sp. GG226]MBU4612380.1 DUF3182 family protein [Verticiella sp. GG226]